MRIGAFELKEPLPELNDCHLLVVLRPWVDVGSVGTLAATTLEAHFGAKDLGRLYRPGEFYDFTRYRPTIQRKGEERLVVVPNSNLLWAKGTGSNDWLFLHLLEPHIRGEELMESVMSLIELFKVRRYGLIGAMYGAWPHTRPLIASGRGNGSGIGEQLDQAGMRDSKYEGPTSLMAMISDEVRQRGKEVFGMLVQLPPYARLEEDHTGHEALLRYLAKLYDWDIDLTEIGIEGEKQYAELDRAMQADRQMKSIVRRLEEAYDAEIGMDEHMEDKTPELPAVVEDFLRDLQEGRSND